MHWVFALIAERCATRRHRIDSTIPCPEQVRKLLRAP
jgi:hypothetical protein